MQKKTPFLGWRPRLYRKRPPPQGWRPRPYQNKAAGTSYVSSERFTNRICQPSNTMIMAHLRALLAVSLAMGMGMGNLVAATTAGKSVWYKAGGYIVFCIMYVAVCLCCVPQPAPRVPLCSASSALQRLFLSRHRCSSQQRFMRHGCVFSVCCTCSGTNVQIPERFPRKPRVTLAG